MSEEQQQYGPPAEEEKAYTQRLPLSLWKRVSYYKIETGESKNSLVVRLLSDYLDKRDKK